MIFAIEHSVDALITIFVEASSKEEAIDYVTSVDDYKVVTNHNQIVTEYISLVGEPSIRKARKSELQKN